MCVCACMLKSMSDMEKCYKDFRKKKYMYKLLFFTEIQFKKFSVILLIIPSGKIVQLVSSWSIMPRW